MERPATMPEHTSFLSYLIAMFPALGQNMSNFGQTFIGHKPVDAHGAEPLVASLLVVLVLYFAAPPSLDAAQNGYVPGLLWVAYVFAGVLGMNRAFAAELENDALSALALAPVDRGFLFLGKATASFSTSHASTDRAL